MGCGDLQGEKLTDSNAKQILVLGIRINGYERSLLWQTTSVALSFLAYMTKTKRARTTRTSAMSPAG
ncbi:hypothetical protein CHELA41_50752 [Hyphomicrobiales bacterium]|nr:hypothetical protein CHELA41_50752 [Hyphomicrobiales bacterium]